MIAAVTRQQIVTLQRQRVFLATAATLLVMTALAGVIGWSSHNTILRIYDEATRLLAASGQAAPPNPFDLKPTLSLLSNMTVYIPLIGALLALVIGHLSMIDDEVGGIGRLLFSRPLPRRDYLAGKVLAAAAVLAVTMVISALLSMVSIALVNGQVPALTDVGRVGLFYGLSWLYLLVYALVGMVTVLLTSKRSLALLAAMGAWLVISFAIPQLTSGLNPVATLNPVLDPVGTSQAFFRITANGRALSLVEQYKAASAQILATAPASSLGSTALRVVPIVGSVLVLAGAADRLVRRHDYSKGTSDE